ncbi:hypothetical protein AMJ49_05215 [Parcubacteria bacterium DG_74_2]|nr:MAG: hypothetical protein AMJ49_05215 [Parcubacteria bacterium DG_74_2]
MYYVYLIKSKHKKWIYVGFTSDLKKRFNEHNLGKTKTTKGYKPFFLVYYEAYQSKKDAIIREIELKRNGQQKEFLKERVKNSLGSQSATDQP